MILDCTESRETVLQIDLSGPSRETIFLNEDGSHKGSI